MSDNLDFLEKEESLDSKALATLQQKLANLKEKRFAIDEVEERLKAMKNEERKISREEIPAYLLQFGINKLSLADGTSVEIKEDLTLSLPKTDPLKRKEAIAFIIAQGGGGLLKDNLTIEDPSLAVMSQLDAEGMAYKRTQDINTASLKAFFRGLLGLKKNTIAEITKEDTPKALNLYVYRETKIK